MTTTEEQFTNDNLGNQSESTVQNVEQFTTSIPKPPEPEVNKKTAVPGTDDNQFIDIPQKFQNKDGSANVASLVKSYKALEPLLNEKANWAKEKETLENELLKFNLKNNSISAYAPLSVKLYEDVLEKSSNPEKAKSLIEKFSQAPSAETIKELESLFPPEVLKANYLSSMVVSNAYLADMMQKQQQAEYENVEKYLKEVTQKNSEALKNPVTVSLFNEAFMHFGSDFDADWFFDKMDEFKKSIIADYQKEQNLKNESERAIETAGKMSPRGSATGKGSLLSRNALDLSKSELNRMLDEYYSK